MADKTNIEWTDATWNPITGCDVFSPGCTNCYAMRLAGTRLKHHPSRKGLTRPSKAGPVWTGEIRFNEQWLDQPLRWKKPRRIFVCAHGDLFHENVNDEMLDKVFAVMALCRHHEFQVLTKRSDRMLDYLSGYDAWVRVERILGDIIPNSLWNGSMVDARLTLQSSLPLPNVLLGTSIEDQRRANIHQYFMKKLSLDRWRTFVSYEPALELVDWYGWAFLDWLICGGESGPGARPMHPDSARAARDYCERKAIPYLFKQWGAWLPSPDDLNFGQGMDWAREFGNVKTEQHSSGHTLARVGKKRAGRMLDGVEHNGFPTTKDHANG